MTLDPDALRYLSSAILERAIRDMRTRGETIGNRWVVLENFKAYVNAIVWLGSNRAALYIDIVGLEQEEILYAIKWKEHAQEMMDNPKALRLLTDNDITLLYKSIKRLNPLRGYR
jgi:hypothetical protein|tara:strand:- start:491 stop:835 length:345 start_codon:yes stop_codon:yes gene_type:complete